MPDVAAVDQAICDEETAVLHWRVRRFLELGFTLRQARTLSALPADWHAAQELLSVGCPLRHAYDLLR